MSQGQWPGIRDQGPRASPQDVPAEQNPHATRCWLSMQRFASGLRQLQGDPTSHCTGQT